MIKGIVLGATAVVLGLVLTAAPFASKKASAYIGLDRCSSKTLVKGNPDTTCNRMVQDIMNEAHVLKYGWADNTTWPLLKVDGLFGSQTEKAVKAFQADAGITADGKVGPQTWFVIYYKCSNVWPKAPYYFTSPYCIPLNG
jgi:peptidoglycan hydrolase-like protein with peptidoglycan-binding domain